MMTTTDLRSARRIRCPVCDQADLLAIQERWLIVRRRRALVCPSCGARFEERGAGRFILAVCNPARVATVRGMQEPLGCSACLPCPVGQSKSLEDWDRLRQTLALSPDDLPWPVIDPQRDLVALEAGETLRFVQHGVGLGEVWEPEAALRGALLITDRRLIYRGPGGEVFDLFLERIAAVEDCPPALTITLRDRREPFVIFSRTGDRSLQAVARLLVT